MFVISNNFNKFNNFNTFAEFAKFANYSPSSHGRRSQARVRSTMRTTNTWMPSKAVFVWKPVEFMTGSRSGLRP